MFRRSPREPVLTNAEILAAVAMLMAIDQRTKRILEILEEDTDDEDEP